MIPMVNKRLYQLVLRKYNELDDDNSDIRTYTYTNLEYALYNGLRTVLKKYIEVNGIDYDKFKDFYGRTFKECIYQSTFTVSLGVDDGNEYFLEASIQIGDIVDDDFMDDFLEDFLKIKKEEN